MGAGVLALPSVTFSAGVIPSTLLLLWIWGYTLVSGLLIAEVNVRHLRSTGEQAGLLGITEHFLGGRWSKLATLAFLFLHYALLVAYVSEGSATLKLALARTPLMQVSFSLEIILFVLLLGGLIYLGSRQFVAAINTILVVGVVTTFIGLISAIATEVDWSHLALQNWTAATPAIPVILVALFYHNVIPVVTTRLAGDPKSIRLSLIVGSAIPLLMFLVWNGVVLCTVGPDALALGIDPLDVLRQQLSDGRINILVTGFSLLAIATSFIGVSYGLLNLFQDLWRESQKLGPRFGNDQTQRFSMNALVFLPPMGLCSLNPDLFIAALSYAGTFSVATLYGLLPAVLAWRSRAVESEIQPWVRGGRWSLGLMIGLGLGLVVLGS